MRDKIEKHSSIHRLLLGLDRELGHDIYVIEDDWEGDLCAIGIANPRDLRLVVYVSTYELPDGRFYFECETRSAPGSDKYEVTNKEENVSFEELLSAIRSHFRFS